MKLRWIATATLAASAALAPAAFAADEDPGQKAFVAAYVDSINSRDAAQRLALVHSGSRHCVQDPGALQQTAASRRLASMIPADYRWGVVEYPANIPLMFEDKYDYPVRPTHIIELLYDRSPTQKTSLVIQAARDGADWREVVPCKKPAVMEQLRAARAEQAKHMARADALLAQMRPEVRAEIVKMVRDGRKHDAIKHYHSSAGEDLSVAKYVVERLSETVMVQ
jgi:hypothetical protein